MSLGQKTGHETSLCLPLPSTPTLLRPWNFTYTLLTLVQEELACNSTPGAVDGQNVKSALAKECALLIYRKTALTIRLCEWFDLLQQPFKISLTTVLSF
ncbi:hypothetical protein V1478_016289 [Vespula squamosa]|uniref:Uncharacterized protein n=1 Tax=Vespula squamosa TaxID=30214 RepID=A0ABD1ZZD7_VESSQ